jgi:serine/threonine protein kinase
VVSPAVPPAVRRLGRYTLCKEIGSGGMGAVRVGRLDGPVGFSRIVAVKELHPYFARDPELVAMFVDEARIASRVRHPNVVPTLDVVSRDNELFLVMEYVAGASVAYLLRAARRANERVPIALAATIAHAVLLGLHAAHEAKGTDGRALGIVHRDVCPANILVGVDGVARVFDFGIAKAAGRLAKTSEGVIKGKLAYMAPEQAAAGLVDRRADVYSVGVVLWEMLTGRRLFSGDHESEVLARVLRGNVSRPGDHGTGTPAALDEVVMRATQREPADRFGSAHAMAEALAAAVALTLPSALGAWVERLGSEELNKRAEAVREVEALPDSPPSDTLADASKTWASDTHPMEEAPPKRRLARRHLLALALLPLGSLAVIGLAAAWHASAKVPMPATNAGSPAVPSADTMGAPLSANEESGATGALATGGSAGGPFPVTASKQDRGHAPPVPRRAHCDPAYWFDAQGIKHYKLECQRP